MYQKQSLRFEYFRAHQNKQVAHHERQFLRHNYFIKMGLAAFFACLLLVSILPINMAMAGASLVVRPTRIVITENEPVMAISVQNMGDAEASIQLQLLQWSQKDNEDVYMPTDEVEVCLVACPPIFTVAAGQSQIVRIGLERFDRDWSVEGVFRLFIQEIPKPLAADETGVQVALRIGVPVFIEPKNTAQPAMIWKIESVNNNGLWITATNEGNAHVLISNVALSNNQGLNIEIPTHQYILPNSTMKWQLNTTATTINSQTGNVTMIAVSDQGTYSKTLMIGQGN